MLPALVAALCLSRLPDVKALDGHVYKMSGRPATVVVFVTVDCPISNQYQPELERLRKRFEPDGVGFFQIQVDPAVTGAAVEKHAKEYQVGGISVLDPKHTIVKAFGAKLTPEAFVVDRTGKVAYQGRVDDRYSSLGQQRAQVKSHDLADAVRAVLVGKRPKVAKTEAFGCLMPRIGDGSSQFR